MKVNAFDISLMLKISSYSLTGCISLGLLIYSLFKIYSKIYNIILYLYAYD